MLKFYFEKEVQAKRAAQLQEALKKAEETAKNLKMEKRRKRMGSKGEVRREK